MDRADAPSVEQEPAPTSKSDSPVRELSLPLAHGYSAALVREGSGARFRIGRAGDQAALEFSIELTERGPVVRARAAALELESDGDIVARCENFRVEARSSLALSTQGPLRAEGRKVEIEASLGAVRVKANDEVQLLGEQVLLNCEPPPPMPAWALPTPLYAHTVAPRDVSGDLPVEQLLGLGAAAVDATDESECDATRQ